MVIRINIEKIIKNSIISHTYFTIGLLSSSFFFSNNYIYNKTHVENRVGTRETKTGGYGNNNFIYCLKPIWLSQK